MVALRRIGRREDGVAMLTVVILVAFLSMVSVALIDLVTSESTRSNSARTSNAAFQAAEAGLDDYLSKLVDDKTYYLHHVHPAESTRRPTAGADVDPLPNGTTCNATKTGALGIDWTGTAIWDPSIAGGKDNWCQLANGYEYNLQITPPSATNESIQILSTGRKICSPAYSTSSSCAPGTSTTQWRAVQEWVHWSLLSDFQMITNSDYSAGVDCDDERQDLRRARLERQQPRHRSRGHRHGQSLRRRDDHRTCQPAERGPEISRHDDSHAAPGPDQLQQLHLVPRRPQDGGDLWGRVLRRQLPDLEVRAARERHLHRSGLHANRR